jgi:hypothetical protein
MAAKTGKSTKATRKGKKNAYARDDNPALQKMVRELRSLLAAARLEGKPRMKGMNGKR